MLEAVSLTDENGAPSDSGELEDVLRKHVVARAEQADQHGRESQRGRREAERVVAVPNTDAERERGLMFRDALLANHGMLFVHARQEPQAYWMKNTRIPLDILYFDNARKLVSQQRDVPSCSLGDACPPYPSEAPARYVLELNAGEAARLGLRNGSKLSIDPHIAPAH